MRRHSTLSDASSCSAAGNPIAAAGIYDDDEDDVWDLASVVDHLHRFHGNALVFDVLCYCLAQRLALGIDSVHTLLFFLPQFLVCHTPLSQSL